MIRLTQSVLKQIEARYIHVGTRSYIHSKGAVARIEIKVNGRTWELFISPSRYQRSVDDSVKAIILHTKVGKKILRKAARSLKLSKRKTA